jgi:hypothetical protein
MKKLFLGLLGVLIFISGVLVSRFYMASDQTQQSLNRPVSVLGETNRTNIPVQTNRVMWREIESAEYPHYVINLRNIGCPEPTVEDIIVADVNAYYLEKTKPILHALQEAMNRYYASPRPTNSISQVLGETGIVLKRTDGERVALIVHLLGHDVDKSKIAIAPWDYLLKEAQNSNFPYVSIERRTKAIELRDELQRDMRALIRPGHGVNAATAKQLDALNQQYYKKLADILTPEEMEAFMLHDSMVGASVARKLEKIQLGDDQYIQVFDAWKAFTTKYGEMQTTIGFPPEDPQQQTTELSDELALQAKIKEILGDQAYSDYLRNNDPQFWNDTSFATQNGLSTDQAAKLYDLRRTAMQAMVALGNTPNLSAEQRSSQVAAIISTAQNQLSSVLGQELQSGYLNGPTGGWLKGLQQTGQLWSPGTKSEIIPLNP